MAQQRCRGNLKTAQCPAEFVCCLKTRRCECGLLWETYYANELLLFITPVNCCGYMDTLKGTTPDTCLQRTIALYY